MRLSVIRTTLVATFLLVAFGQISFARGWRGVAPLQSKRADVERLLGKGSDACNCSYYLTDVNVFFQYSSGDCKGGGGWNVPKDTVINVTIYPHVNPSLNDLKLDMRRFKITEEPELPGIFQYYDEDEGFLLEVENGIVRGLYYTPTARDKLLRCPVRRA